ncbi:unnamed protein product, partial [Mycena citricolor]
MRSTIKSLMLSFLSLSFCLTLDCELGISHPLTLQDINVLVLDVLGPCYSSNFHFGCSISLHLDNSPW